MTDNKKNKKGLLKWELFAAVLTNINPASTNATGVHRPVMSVLSCAWMSLTWRLGKTTLHRWWNVPVSAKRLPASCHRIPCMSKNFAGCARQSATSVLSVVQNFRMIIVKNVPLNVKNALLNVMQCETGLLPVHKFLLASQRITWRKCGLHLIHEILNALLIRAEICNSNNSGLAHCQNTGL